MYLNLSSGMKEMKGKEMKGNERKESPLADLKAVDENRLSFSKTVTVTFCMESSTRKDECFINF